MLFIHAKAFIIIFQQAHKMLQALSNNYACLQAHVNNTLTWQSSCVIASNARKTANAICSRLVHDVIKYTRKHRATKCYRRLRNNCPCLQALVNNGGKCLITNNARKTAKAICPKL